MEERYQMALEAIIKAHAHGSDGGSWLQAAFTMKDIAVSALLHERKEKS